MLDFHLISLAASEELSRHCVRCSSTRPPASLQDVKNRLEQVTKLGVQAPNIMFGGLEPFAYPGLVEALAQARLWGACRIGLVTDGGALSVRDNARGCLEAGVRVFEIPLLGSSAEVHDELSGASGLFNALSQGIVNIRDMAQDLGVKVFLCASVELCAHNVTELLSMAPLCAQLGFDAVRLSCSDTVSVSEVSIEAFDEQLTTQAIALFGKRVSALSGAQLYTVTAHHPEKRGDFLEER